MILQIVFMLWMISDSPGCQGEITLVMDDHATWDESGKKWYVFLKCGPFDDDSHQPSLKFTSETEETHQENRAITLTDYSDRFFRYKVTQPGFYECFPASDHTPSPIGGVSIVPFAADLEVNSYTLKQLIVDARITHLESHLHNYSDVYDRKVCFHTRMTREERYYRERGMVIKMTRVVLNQGNAYNATSGIFTAPYNGLYFFMASTATTTITTSAGMLLEVSGSPSAVSRLQIYHFFSSEAGSVHAALSLQVGQTVSVQTRRDVLYFSDGTSFSGFLFSPEL